MGRYRIDRDRGWISGRRGIRGIKAGGWGPAWIFFSPRQGRRPSVGWPRVPLSCTSMLAFSILLPRLSPPPPRKMLRGSCRRVPGPGGGACEVCVLSSQRVCQAMPPQAKMGLPCASWVWGSRAETPAPGTDHYTALLHGRPRASEPRTCRRSSGRQGALGARGWRREARPGGMGTSRAELKQVGLT